MLLEGLLVTLGAASAGAASAGGGLLTFIQDDLRASNVEVDKSWVDAEKQVGDVFVAIYKIAGEMFNFLGVVHLSVATWTDYGWRILTFGANGLETQPNILMWKSIHLHALIHVGKCVRSLHGGQQIPIVTQPGLMSDLKGESPPYHLLKFNCIDAAWSIISWITGNRFQFLPETVRKLHQFRTMYMSSPTFQAYMDAFLDDDDDDDAGGASIAPPGGSLDLIQGWATHADALKDLGVGSDRFAQWLKAISRAGWVERMEYPEHLPLHSSLTFPATHAPIAGEYSTAAKQASKVTKVKAKAGANRTAKAKAKGKGVVKKRPSAQ